MFINDLWSLLINNRDNRRFVLQMSVWQNWLINLIENKNELITNQILAIFRILLYHAIKYEYGGWRVWIDTLAIIHAKISYDDFTEQFGKSSRPTTTSTSTNVYNTTTNPSFMKNMINNKNLENIKASLAAVSKAATNENSIPSKNDETTTDNDGQQTKITEETEDNTVNHNESESYPPAI
ncbi:hypothetical protein BLA29_011068, partial [Euroglyphus maynei]